MAEMSWRGAKIWSTVYPALNLDNNWWLIKYKQVKIKLTMNMSLIGNI